MDSTRAIAIGGLGLALALAVGAVGPGIQPRAEATDLQPIILIATARAVAMPTPALAIITPAIEHQNAPTLADQVDPVQQAQLLADQQQAIIIQQLAADQAAAAQAVAPVEQLPQVAQLPAAPVEQIDSTLAIEQAAAAVYAYADLPTAGPMPAPAPAGEITDRQRQQSRQRTR